MIAIRTFIILTILAANSLAAATAPKIPYAEFNKILKPYSHLPLPGGETSLFLVALPSDPYPQLYKLDHKTQKFIEPFNFGRPIDSITSDPLNKRIYLSVDNNGDENFGIYTYDIKMKKAEPLFVHANARASVVDFSPDAELLYLSSNHEAKAIFSIYSLNLKDKSLQRLTDGKQSWYDAKVNADSTLALLTSADSDTETRVALLDIKSKKAIDLLSKPKTLYQSAFFDPKVPDLAYVISNQDRDRNACAKFKVGKPQESWEWIHQADDKDYKCAYQPGSDMTSVYETYEGKEKLRIFDGIFGAERKIDVPERSIASSFRRIKNEKWAYLRLESFDSPREYYQLDLSKAPIPSRVAITQVNQSSIAATDFGQSFDFHYKSFDGRDIHAIIFAKKEWLAGKEKRPVIVVPHGGPSSHDDHSYSPPSQFFVQNGFIVFSPNFRGSTGYGKNFERMNDRDWGGGHIKDVVWGKREFAKQDYVDPKRIFIAGSSFGGYSVLSAITQYPQEFRAATAMLAIANLFTLMKSIPPDPAWQGEFLKEVGDPIRDKDLLRERSPYFHVNKIVIPLKIYQAENDVRTVKAEMDNFVAELKAQKIPVEYKILEKEGHGVSRAESWQELLQGTSDFFHKFK